MLRPIEHGSAEYLAACELRRLFLREPLGLELTAADTAGEESQHHFGLFDRAVDEGAVDEGAVDEGAGKLIGGVIGKPDPDDATTVRIRQMVVHEDHRGEGRGRELLLGAERLLAERGYTRVVLFARAEATPFYAKCGYADTGATAELIGMPHHRMEKEISGRSAVGSRR